MRRDKNGRFKEKYTDEELDWINKNFNKYDLNALTKVFNCRFNKSLSKSNLRYITYVKLNLRKVSKYTDLQDEWLKANVENYVTYKELASAFNGKFNQNRSKEAIEMRMQTVLGYKKKVNVGRFQKGVVNTSGNEAPIGAEWRDEKRGVVYVKTKMHEKDRCIGNSFQYPYWTLKHRLIYENAHGKINDDEMIIFLDGNKENFNIDNLYCIKRKYWIRLVNNHWYGVDADLTNTAIKLLELINTVKKFEQKKKPDDRL